MSVTMVGQFQRERKLRNVPHRLKALFLSQSLGTVWFHIAFVRSIEIGSLKIFQSRTSLQTHSFLKCALWCSIIDTIIVIHLVLVFFLLGQDKYLQVPSTSGSSSRSTYTAISCSSTDENPEFNKLIIVLKNGIVVLRCFFRYNSGKMKISFFFIKKATTKRQGTFSICY